MIAALYVQKDGAYFGLPDVDPWDEERDARRYAGPWSVVAHPPCNKWSPLAYINQARIPGYRIGDDGGCFRSALASVERWGGVLEHPASSVAWDTFGLPKPKRGYWLQSFAVKGWVTEVDQGRYGHRAKKTTWLYAVTDAPPALDWTKAESDAIVSGFTHQKRGDHVACERRRVRPREASRTPEAFRDVLLEIARGAEGMSATLAKCRGCGKRTDRVVSLRETPLDVPRHVWECASCEYLRLNPSAKRGIAYPRERRAPIQTESLL